jgi:hypothetical protein
MPRWPSGKAQAFKPKACIVCGASFAPKSGVHKFCSESCKGRWKYITGSETTETQYEKISGNWSRYYSRLLAAGSRRQDGLTVDCLLQLHEKQKGLCAISGLEMTCNLKRGSVCFTNASIDRIIAGGLYSKDNIQLVCRHVNSWRNSLPLEDFVNVCRAVVAHHESEK